MANHTVDTTLNSEPQYHLVKPDSDQVEVKARLLSLRLSDPYSALLFSCLIGIVVSFFLKVFTDKDTLVSLQQAAHERKVCTLFFLKSSVLSYNQLIFHYLEHSIGPKILIPLRFSSLDLATDYFHFYMCKKLNLL